MKKSFWIYLILTFIMMAVIFCFSAQVSDQSTKISMSMTNKIVKVEDYQDVPKQELNKKLESVETLVRKSAHMIIFMTLGFCSFMTLYHSEKMHKKYILCIISLVFCIIYASTDEFHQLFVEGRSGEIRDVLIDSAGALVGIFIACGVLKIKKNIQNKKK